MGNGIAFKMIREYASVDGGGDAVVGGISNSSGDDIGKMDWA